MLDLDRTSVYEECVMMCTGLHYEDADENLVVYGDKRITQKSMKKLYMVIL